MKQHKMIASGDYHIIIKNEKNEIYVCGKNEYGQLGLCDNYSRNKFKKVTRNFGKIKNIACGHSHTVIQNEKNEIYVCGVNWNSQLGLGDRRDRNKFEKVEYKFGEIKNIACGDSHTLIQNEKNEIYVCGHNGFGQLGLGDNKNRDKFEKVECDFGEIKNIACGVYHTIIQNEKNEIYACGCNSIGQLGLGDDKNRNEFEKVEYDFGEIKNIACRENYIIIQNEKNEIYVCGSNSIGQLGLGDYKHRNKFEKVNFDFGEIKKIACGDCHTVIQNEENEIYVCGGNFDGQLGLGDNGYRCKFEKVEYDFSDIKNIVCGRYHIIVQNEKNEIYVCGDNRYGQLGLGDDNNRYKFEKINLDNILEKIYYFKLKLNTKEIAL